MITDDLYVAIRRELKKLKPEDDPKTCNDIYDAAAIRKFDDVSNEDVSNAMAALWRRGQLERFAVNRSFGRGPRYGYKLRDAAVEAPAFKPTQRSVNIDNLAVTQSDDGTVTFETDRLIITVRPAGVGSGTRQ